MKTLKFIGKLFLIPFAMVLVLYWGIVLVLLFALTWFAMKMLAKSPKKYTGDLLPTNDEELAEFERIHGKDQVPLPDHLKNPDFLFKKKQTTPQPRLSIRQQQKAERKIMNQVDKALNGD